MPKFDVVIGNPPYQGTGRKKLFINFIEKSLTFIKDDGYFSFIVPKISLNYLSGIEVGQKKRKTQVNFELINISNDIKKHFPGVNSDFCYFVIKNDKKITNTKIILNDNQEIETKLNFQEAIPFSANNKAEYLLYTSILKKTCNFKNELGRKVSRIDEDLFDSPNKTIKNKILVKILNNSFVWKYTSKFHSDMEKYKILLPTVGNNYYIDEGENIFPGTSFVCYIVADSKEELANLKFYILESKLFNFLEKAFISMRSSRDYILKVIKKVDLTHSWTDEELYKHFNLTQEEIDFIEGIIKLKPRYAKI